MLQFRGCSIAKPKCVNHNSIWKSLYVGACAVVGCLSSSHAQVLGLVLNTSRHKRPKESFLKVRTFEWWKHGSQHDCLCGRHPGRLTYILELFRELGFCGPSLLWLLAFLKFVAFSFVGVQQMILKTLKTLLQCVPLFSGSHVDQLLLSYQIPVESPKSCL